jgi:hypothetical protein
MPALAVQLLAYDLEGGPAAASRSWCGQADPGEPGGVGQVSHWQRGHLVVPKVAGEGHQWRQAGFGEVAVPLGPNTVWAVGQVEGVHDRAVLPAVVPRWFRSPGGVGSSGHVPPPVTFDGGGIDVQLQACPKRRQATPGR